MKIVFTMAYMQGGGAERVVSELANCFAGRGHEVSIITTRGGNCVYPLDENVQLIDLSGQDRGILSRVRAVRKCIKENRFDAVISFLVNTNIETILSGLFLKTPVIISERNNPYVDPKNKIFRIMRSFTYPFADGYVFQTPDAREFFGKGIQKHSTVIMNPINPELPEPFQGLRDKRIVNVGRLVPQKNQKMFIDAFAEFFEAYPDYIAEIYGDGPMEQELAAYIQSKQLEEKVILKGFSKNVIPEIASAGIFAMSSDYEGMSNALIEAVGMGIPCVCTDHPIGGARMTIEEGISGFLVPVGDAHAMAEKMKAIAADPAMAESFSGKGLQLRQTLSIDAIADQWLAYMGSFTR
ncbi:MAG: glycosyltransferase family 4 protein [Ruminococcaceae bacterium]|nr:glycosyltransferase family 4 protein [Oscillospiraceae bacterium]